MLRNRIIFPMPDFETFAMDKFDEKYEAKDDEIRAINNKLRSRIQSQFVCNDIRQ